MAVLGVIRADTYAPVERPEQECQIGIERAAGVLHDRHRKIEDQVRIELLQVR